MTSFGELVGCRLPVQLAAFGGGIGYTALASAVTSAGGLGMVGVVGMSPAAVVDTLDDAGAAGPVGVNFLVPFLDRDAVRAAASRAPVVEFFYGDPSRELVDLVGDGGALAGWQVGSADEAAAAASAGCGYVIVQGTEAGGHVRGTSSLSDVLRDVAGRIDVPIVAAGGIATGDDVVRALEAGASAVRVGTRFLAATESCAHDAYVDALIGARAEDTVLTEAFAVGWPDAPHRVLRSSIDAAEASEDDIVATTRIAGVELPVQRFSALHPTTSTTGNVGAMALYAGTSVAGVTRRQPAAEIVAELCSAL